MHISPSPIATLLVSYHHGESRPLDQARQSLQQANSNAGRNTYISLDPEWVLSEAERLTQPADDARQPLFGVPVSLKDCFDLEGFPTSIGSKFYAARGPASADSWVAERLRGSGAVIIGKGHLHQLAYGITGENRDYGDCLQPADPTQLTGGSSSGAVASIQEGSTLAAIGTDTGGSVRLPAAICGLAGYRSSLGAGDWRGGYHLAPAFDTIGWLFRDLRDAPLLAHALFDLPPYAVSREGIRVGVLSGDFMDECDPPVRHSLLEWQQRIARASAAVETFVVPDFWFDAWDIYAPLQASEASQIHAGHFRQFEPAIAARLEWGAALTEEEVQRARSRHRQYRQSLESVFGRFDFVLAPVTGVSRLPAGADHSNARTLILPHTTPASLGGLPAVVLPSPGCGVQLMAARNDDRRLLRFSARLGEFLAKETSASGPHS